MENVTGKPDDFHR